MEEAQAGGNALGVFPDVRGAARNGRASLGEIRAAGGRDSGAVWAAARVGARGLSASLRKYIFLNTILTFRAFFIEFSKLARCGYEGLDIANYS